MKFKITPEERVRIETRLQNTSERVFAKLLTTIEATKVGDIEKNPFGSIQRFTIQDFKGNIQRSNYSATIYISEQIGNKLRDEIAKKLAKSKYSPQISRFGGYFIFQLQNRK